MDTARLREMVAMKEIDLHWVPSEKQLADCMTKRGAASELLRTVLASGAYQE